MKRILIWGIVVTIFLMIIGANDAAKFVINGTLSIAKWIAIIGVIIFVLLLLFSNKDKK
jgi:hypothetical protein